MSLDLVIRELNREDPHEVHLVLRSWLTSYADSADVKFYCQLVCDGSRRPYFDEYGPRVEELIARSTVIVAAMPEREDAVAGWACLEGEVLHYVFVKPKWQRLGVARLLLGEAAEMPVVYTHRTFLTRELPVPEKWTYEPKRRFKQEAE